MHLTMIFADGLGLGAEYNNPVVLARTPNIDRLLGGNFLWGERVIKHNRSYLYSLDATLGVPGTPQSATGQTALWTGVNTAKELGYHLNAYPNEILMEIINKESIFKQLSDIGMKAAFANAFTTCYEELVTEGKNRHSASTLCALAGGIGLRRREDLLAGKAVYQDITNEIYKKRGEDVPLIDPFSAGKNLAGISLDHEFVLFEYFQSDIRGHKRDMKESVRVIETLDEFLGGYLQVIEALDQSKYPAALILTSDHGNIEDMSTSLHTLNKVPALCWSNFGLEWPRLEKLEDVTPAIRKILEENRNNGNITDKMVLS